MATAQCNPRCMIEVRCMISRTISRDKERLVNLGLACLARGEWGIVAAITRLIQQRGWRHA
jgi:hypothetical protein